jgi:Interferon-induced transmembrane protein/zinc-ribbon domain
LLRFRTFHADKEVPMNCPKCGSPNPDNARACGACGASLFGAGSGGAAPAINNWLIPAIFSTVCCCLPLGIVSIVYAAQVNGKLAGGDFAGAKQSADNAKMWFWIAFGLGIALNIVGFFFGLIGGLAGLQQGHQMP